MKVYTRTGDSGTTGLLGGDRTPKRSLRISAIGDVDELNAAIGIAATTGFAYEDLSKVQNWLFDLGSELACPPGGKFQIESVGPAHIEWLEQSMDAQETHLEPLKEFILPGGHPSAAHLHLARTICRRAERSLWHLAEEEPVREVVLTFLNRLSDWLFVSARTANAVHNVSDRKWQKAEVSA